MSQANKILKLIENVQPEDIKSLDEIDTLVWQYLNEPLAVASATRSRDILKAIRPEGWNLDIHHIHPPYYSRCKIFLSGGYRDKEAFFSPEFETEELAELHAIIQAIEHERTKGETK